jgi:hypothetical protein
MCGCFRWNEFLLQSVDIQNLYVAALQGIPAGINPLEQARVAECSMQSHFGRPNRIPAILWAGWLAGWHQHFSISSP